MKSGSGFVLVFVGLLVLWMAITGKLSCLSAFASCLTGSAAPTGGTAGSGGAIPSLPPLPSFGPFTGGK